MNGRTTELARAKGRGAGRSAWWWSRVKGRSGRRQEEWRESAGLTSSALLGFMAGFIVIMGGKIIRWTGGAM